MTMMITQTTAAMTVSLLIFSMESEVTPSTDSMDILIACHALVSADHNAQKSNIMSMTSHFTSHGMKMLLIAMITQRTPG